MRTAIGSMPLTALMTTAAVSTASSAGSDWPTKSGAPGVSMKCTRVPAWRRCITAAFSECCMRRSSGSKSLTVLPRSSEPGAAIMPARCSKASARLVLPAAAGPTSASVRIWATASAACTAPLGVGLGMGSSPAALQRAVGPNVLGRRRVARRPGSARLFVFAMEQAPCRSTSLMPAR